MQNKNLIVLLIACAILTGILYIGPQALIAWRVHQQGKTYSAVQYNVEANELEMDLPRAREIYDGHFPPAELFAEKQLPTPLNPLPVLLLSLPIFLFKGNINAAYLANQFIFPIILFLAFYFIGRVAIRDKIGSLFFAFLGALTPLARYLVRGFSSLEYFSNLVLKNFYPLVQSPLEFLFLHKVTDPLITFVFYLPAIGALIWFWKEPKKSSAILAGLLIGLMFYVYWHYWVYLIMTLALLGIYIIARKKSDPENLKVFLNLLGVLILVAAPYFINYLTFQHLPVAKEVVERLGVVERGRHLMTYSGVWGDYLFYLVTAVLVYFIFWRKSDSERRRMAILFWAFLAAILIVWNLQVISGFTLVADHWRLAFSPIALVVAAAIFYELGNRWIKNGKIWKSILVALMILLVIKKIVNVFAFTSISQDLISKYSSNSELLLAFQWMDKNLPKEAKIISPTFIDSMYLSIYTSSRPYLPFYTTTLLSNADLEKRFLVSQKLFGVSRDNLEKELRWQEAPYGGCKSLARYFSRVNLTCDGYTEYGFENGRFLYGFRYFPENFSTIGSTNFTFYVPEGKIRELSSRYSQTRSFWGDVEADYVFYGPWDRNLAGVDLSQDRNLILIYKNPLVEIYKVRR